MADEAKVKMRLDTKQAKRDLKGFVSESAMAAGKISGGIKSTIGKGLGAVGLGAGLATGMGAIRGATSGGVSDIAGEAFGAIGRQIGDFILGDFPEEARATHAAREQTIAAFGALSRDGNIPAGALSTFKSIKGPLLDQELGRKAIESDPRFRSGVDVDDIIERIGATLGKELQAAVQSFLVGLVTPEFLK
tara:strand:- start:19656 stop:20228 length:573 start_codon:yes stop_codon:yes gene_type:complete